MSQTIDIEGVVEAIDKLDDGRTAGVSIRRAGRPAAYVRMTIGGDDMLIERVGAAWLRAEPVVVRCDALPPRLGAPVGEIRAVLPKAA